MSKIRPLSPHLQIYKIQITSLLSIMHRLTGILLLIGLLILSWGFISYFLFPQVIYKIYSVLSQYDFLLRCFKLLAFIWLNVFCYHYLNGIRHMLWDLGLGFTKSAVKITGISVVGLCLFSSLILYNFFIK